MDFPRWAAPRDIAAVKSIWRETRSISIARPFDALALHTLSRTTTANASSRATLHISKVVGRISGDWNI